MTGASAFLSAIYISTKREIPLFGCTLHDDDEILKNDQERNNISFQKPNSAVPAIDRKQRLFIKKASNS